MPHFFFDIDGQLDLEGFEFATAQVACAQAIDILPQLLTEQLPIAAGQRKQTSCVVRDHAGHRLCRVALELSTEILLPPTSD